MATALIDESTDEESETDTFMKFIEVFTHSGAILDAIFKGQVKENPRKRKRPGVKYSRRAKTKRDYEETSWMKLIRNPLTRVRHSFYGKLFRTRFRVPFSRCLKLRDIFIQRNWLQKAD